MPANLPSPATVAALTADAPDAGVGVGVMFPPMEFRASLGAMLPVNPMPTAGPLSITCTNTSRPLGSDHTVLRVLSRRVTNRFSARGFAGSPVYSARSTPPATGGSYATVILMGVVPRYENRYQRADCGSTDPEKRPSTLIGMASVGSSPGAARALVQRCADTSAVVASRTQAALNGRSAT